MQRWASHISAFVVGAVVATAVGAIGAPKSSARFAKLDVFAQALSYIENNYVDPIDESALMYGAVDGMVDRLDRFSTFLAPEEYRRLREDTEGEYAGIGVALEADVAGVPIVIEVIDGSPAERAGLLAGDRIVSIGGASTTGVDEAWRGTLRGPAGTRVAIEVERDGWEAARSFRLRRRRIRLSAVETRILDGGVAYVHIRRFQGDTASEVKKALRTAATRAGGSLPGVVLDLRGNPGGLFDQAVDVADLFVDQGVLVQVKSRLGQVDKESAHAAGTWSGFPMSVLVDERSASSAEIVAAALQDHGRAAVVGVPSFGKGSVQTFLDLDDGSGLKLTTSRYYTPAGQSIEGTGIQPDVVVERREDQLETAYQILHTLGLSK